MALNGYGGEKRGPQGRDVPPVTLPTVELTDIDIEREAREAAERVAERRVIRNGRDAWQAIGKVETLDAWRKIAAALHVGKLRAIRVTRSNSGWGRAYSLEFGRWCREFGFTMPKAARSWALALHENRVSIERWFQGLSERDRKKLKNPQSVVRRWQRETQTQINGKHHDDVAMALAAWKRFVWCLRSLPAHEAGPLWEMACAEAAGAR